MMLSLFLACGGVHHAAEGTTGYTGAAAPYGSRLLIDGETAQSALDKADGKSVVTVSTSVGAPFGQSSTTSVTVAPAYGYGAPAYQSGLDPQLWQAVQLSAAYRAQHPAVPQSVGGASYRSTAASVPAAKAECPEGRHPVTQAEIDACQWQDIDTVLETAGLK
jgi:hypothetical protein